MMAAAEVMTRPVAARPSATASESPRPVPVAPGSESAEGAGWSRHHGSARKVTPATGKCAHETARETALETAGSRRSSAECHFSPSRAVLACDVSRAGRSTRRGIRLPGPDRLRRLLPQLRGNRAGHPAGWTRGRRGQVIPWDSLS
jgi:hypothetical protein